MRERERERKRERESKRERETISKVSFSDTDENFTKRKLLCKQ
jgi:uncharacterized protein YkuJ